MHKLICIVCPRGCHMTIDDALLVTGNACKRGEVYAISELNNPMRMITSTVKLADGRINRLPVVTSAPIPKGKIFEVMTEINQVSLTAPILMHTVIIANVLGLGVDIIATRTIEKLNKEA